MNYVKQDISKVSRKSSKHSENRGGSHALYSNAPTNSKSGELGTTKSGNVISSVPAGSFVSDIGKSNGSKNVRGGNLKLNGFVASSSYEALPGFRDVPNSEKQSLLVKKLNLCCVLFDFTDPTKHLKKKRSSGKHCWKSFSPQPRENKVVDGFDVEEEEPSMDPAWPHLQIVYEFLLRFVASPETDAKLAKRYVDHSFILKLLDLFDSEDPREREYLKTILHRTYGKFMKFWGIINGFALPLKEEHKLFLVRALIPLHKPKYLAIYHQQLSYCITQFVEKDCKLADTVIRGLLKYWPVTNSSKEVLFLSELEEVLEATQPSEFQRCMVPLFRQIAHCLNSSHFQNRKVLLPIIFSALEKNARNHWNQAVHSLTLNVRKLFYDIDPELFKECLLEFQEDESKEDEVKARREATWKRLEEVAAKKASSYEPVLVRGRAPLRTASH
ncbi:hypothetical protein M0R45_021594 [Rubus argutus]|uniref:Serine/threonine protein phosphatase 2A regulatory subunit n=1 Tax=Rubus argutus TaxID=59490 RepID=A0AAW1XDJ5_RUBAR